MENLFSPHSDFTLQKNPLKPLLPTFVDFFAGRGLVTQGVKHACAPVWANDICPRKAAIYTANHGSWYFHVDRQQGRPHPLEARLGEGFSKASGS